MSEYIILETGYPGAVKQEVVAELVRCRDCKYGEKINQVHEDDVMRLCHSSVFSSEKCVHLHDADWFCADGDRR